MLGDQKHSFGDQRQSFGDVQDFPRGNEDIFRTNQSNSHKALEVINQNSASLER